MKHNHWARRWSVGMTERFWQAIAEWRARRLARRALAHILRRENAHLLDDLGIETADVDCRRDWAKRHLFWML